LPGTVTQAQSRLASGDVPDAYFTLGAFLHVVAAQSGTVRDLRPLDR
jgi:hypothetical protein